MANDSKPAKQDRPQPETEASEVERRPNLLPVEEFNFDEYKKAVLADPRSRKVVEDFLKYRHREWEENLISGHEPSDERK